MRKLVRVCESGPEEAWDRAQEKVGQVGRKNAGVKIGYKSETKK